MTRHPYCDCGTCCNTCGHDPDCTSRLIAATEPIEDDGSLPEDYLLGRL